MNQEQKQICKWAEDAGGILLSDSENWGVGYEFELYQLEAFAALVAAAERERITAMLMYLHNQASAYHNYYKHAAIEISWKGDASKGTVFKDYSIGETK
jgi:hypothetical protein